MKEKGKKGEKKEKMLERGKDGVFGQCHSTTCSDLRPRACCREERRVGADVFGRAHDPSPLTDSGKSNPFTKIHTCKRNPQPVDVQSTRALHTAHPRGTQPFYYRSLHNCSKIQLTICRFTTTSTCPRNITLPDDYSIQSAPSLFPRLLLHKQTALTSALTGNAYAARENIIPTSATIHTVSL